MSLTALVAEGNLDTLIGLERRSSKLCQVNDICIETKNNIETISIIKNFDLLENFFIHVDDYLKFEYIELVFDNNVIQHFTNEILIISHKLGNTFLPLTHLNIQNLAMVNVVINIKYNKNAEKIKLYALGSFVSLEHRKHLIENFFINSFQELKYTIKVGETNISFPLNFKFLCKKIAFTFVNNLDPNNTNYLDVLNKGSFKINNNLHTHFDNMEALYYDKMVNNNPESNENIYTITFDGETNKNYNSKYNFSRNDNHIIDLEIKEQKEDIEVSFYYFGLNYYEDGKLKYVGLFFTIIIQYFYFYFSVNKNKVLLIFANISSRIFNKSVSFILFFSIAFINSVLHFFSN
jgi:hypothetical protein